MAVDCKVTIAQERGPALLAARTSLNAGENVALETSDSGLLLIPQDFELIRALDELGEALREGNFDLETLIEDGREIRGELLLELYGIDPSQSRGPARNRGSGAE